MSIDTASLKLLMDAIIDLNGLKKAEEDVSAAEKN